MDKELFDKFLTNFLTHIQIKPGCWDWDGYVGSNAQPKINVYYKGKQREYSVTRFSYLVFLDIDDTRAKNICMNRFCSNPAHRRDYCLDNDIDRLRLEKDCTRLGIE